VTPAIEPAAYEIRAMTRTEEFDGFVATFAATLRREVA